MRAFTSMLLIGLLALCPALCGSAELDHLAHGHAAATGDDAPVPAHCPEDGDNCICQGALVQSDGPLVAAPDILGLPAIFHASDHTHAHPLAHLTRDGSPAGLAGWGDCLTVRAVLQNFRC